MCKNSLARLYVFYEFEKNLAATLIKVICIFFYNVERLTSLQRRVPSGMSLYTVFTKHNAIRKTRPVILTFTSYNTEKRQQ